MYTIIQDINKYTVLYTIIISFFGMLWNFRISHLKIKRDFSNDWNFKIFREMVGVSPSLSAINIDNQCFTKQGHVSVHENA